MFLALQEVDVAGLFRRVFADVGESGAGGHGAFDHLENVKFAEERIDDGFENLANDRSVRICFQHGAVQSLSVVHGRVRHIFDDSVHKTGNADVCGCGAAESKHCFVGHNGHFDAVCDFFCAQSAFVEVFHHELVVGFCGDFNHFASGFFDDVFVFCRDFDFSALQVVSLVFQNVDGADHVEAVHNRHFDDDDVGEFFTDCSDGFHKVAVFFVDAVHEQNGRDLASFDHFQHLFGAYRHAARRAGNHDCAVGNMQRADHFAFEVEESRGVDYVDFVIFPVSIADAHADGYFSCDFFLIEVHRAVAVVDFAESVDGFSVEKNGLCEGGFALAAVSDKRNVANVFCCNLAHKLPHFILFNLS